jgi:serine protease
MRTRWLALVAALALALSAALTGAQAPPPATATGARAAVAYPAQAAQPAAPRGKESADARRAQVLLEKRLAVQDFVPGQVVVKLKPEAAGGAEPAWLSTMSGGGAFRRTSGGELVVTLPGGGLQPMSDQERVQQTLRFVEQLKARPEVDYVQPDYRFQIAAEPRDPRYAEQWHYFVRSGALRAAAGGIGLPTAWDATKGSPDVIVAVIDTGILSGHPDIQGSPNLLPGIDLITDSAVANDGDGRDTDPTDTGDAVERGECGDFLGIPVPDRDLPSSWHGSHVAGTVGVGRTDDDTGVAGVAWRVGIVPVRVLGKCGGSTTDIADAIRWAAGLDVPGVAPIASPARVVNLSLGGRGPCDGSPAMQRAIDDAVAAGTTVVVAAGNEAQDASGFTPAGCRNVISVAAGDREGKLVLRYSNFGAAVDLMAPGGDVARDSDGNGQIDGVLSFVEGGYAYYNGTSMAAPHVAGVAALLLARRPGLSPTEIEAELKSHALARSNSECARPCGAGLLQASFVADLPDPTPPDRPDPVPPDPVQPEPVPALGPFGALVAAGLGALALGRARRSGR